MLVSVIIPTYNRFEFLKEAVLSVRIQAVQDLEIIVVDDGSTDETSRLSSCGEFSYVRMPHCGFPGKVRNLGVEASKGQYITFLDSDDLWKPGKLAKQLHFFQNNSEIYLCHTREIWLREDMVISQSKQKHKRSGNIFDDSLKKCIIGPSTVMLSRELFVESGGFRPDLEIAEDYELWIRICAEHDVGYLDEPLVIKRGGHKDQLSMKYGHIEYFRLKALQENVEKKVFKGKNMELAALELARKCRIYAAGCLKRGRKKEADYYIRLAEDQEQTVREPH